MKQTKVIIIGVVFLILVIFLLVWLLSRKTVKHKVMIEYFSRLFPTGNWNSVSESQVEKIYLGLDAWYENMIPSLKKRIIEKQPNWNKDRMKIWNQQAGVWEKLFDGSVCDCMRFAYPNCKKPVSRFSGANILKDCPLWTGLNIGKTQKTILTQAFNTNNKDVNFISDEYTIKGKGFPNYSWFEGLSYPGEYGLPEVCGDISKKLQPGIRYWNEDKNKWLPLNIPYSKGPWYNSPCKKGKCPLDFLQCKMVKNQGVFPKQPELVGKGRYCIPPQYLKEGFDHDSTPDELYDSTTDENPRTLRMDEMTEQERSTGEDYEKEIDEEYGTNLILPTTTTLQNTLQCQNFPMEPCKKPDQQGFHGLWLYPLRGVGMWRNIGNSVVCNTKLGYLITRKTIPHGGTTPLGAGYKLEDMLELIGKFGGGPQNINLQLKRLINIIQHGSVRKTRNYPKMNIKQLQQHGYEGGVVSNYTQARKIALNLMEKWYRTGYSGIGSKEAPNGFNYNYKKHFPIGCHFGYAAGFDNLVTATMINDKVDTLQLISEPQAAKAGLRPAYIFEIFQITPGKQYKGDWSVFKDSSHNGCKDFYMIDPMVDIDNYLKYGYVAGNKVKNPTRFDPKRMSLTAVKPTFN